MVSKAGERCAGSTTAADVPQLGGCSGVFRNEWVLVSRARCIVLDNRGLPDFRRRRRIVTGEPPARAFDRATVRSGGVSALRECAEREYCEGHSHLISFAGESTSSPPMARSIASIRA